MKKKQNVVKRALQLTKETVCVLQTSQLKNAAGGTGDSHTSCGWPISCKEA